jgi:hypothetical protein
MRDSLRNGVFGVLVVIGVLGVTLAQPRCANAQAAPAAGNPLQGVDFAPYQVDVEREAALVTGQRFLADLKAANPRLASSVLEVARYEVQSDETAKFTRQSSKVMWAYGAAWSILAIFGATLFARQLRLGRELGALEARVRAEK